MQDLVENTADPTHFDNIHMTLLELGKFAVPLVKLKFVTLWKPCKSPNKHMSKITVNASAVFASKFPLFVTNSNLTIIGPTFSRTDIKLSIFGDTKVVELNHVTPVAPNKLHFVSHVFSEPTLKGTICAKLFRCFFNNTVIFPKFHFWINFFPKHASVLQILKDIIIWNNKKHVKNPPFSKKEKTTAEFRRWFSQFYSPNSIIADNK